MVSQVDVLSDREKEILTNYDRLGFSLPVLVSARILHFDSLAWLTELLISYFL